MARIIPDHEPDEIVIGETLSWRKSLAEYPAGDGWALTYYVRPQTSGSGFDQAGAADGSDFLVTVPAATTAALTAGVHNYQAWVVKSGEKYLVEEGQFTARQGFAGTATSDASDQRSPAKKIVDAIDAYFAGGAAANHVLNYQIANRALSHIPDAEKIKLRETYARIYASELRAARVRDGAPFFNTVKVRFK